MMSVSDLFLAIIYITLFYVLLRVSSSVLLNSNEYLYRLMKEWLNLFDSPVMDMTMIKL